MLAKAYHSFLIRYLYLSTFDTMYLFPFPKVRVMQFLNEIRSDEIEYEVM